MLHLGKSNIRKVLAVAAVYGEHSVQRTMSYSHIAFLGTVSEKESKARISGIVTNSANTRFEVYIAFPYMKSCNDRLCSRCLTVKDTVLNLPILCSVVLREISLIGRKIVGVMQRIFDIGNSSSVEAKES